MISNDGNPMTYEHIRYEMTEGIATITLDRPEKLNAWNPVMEGEVRTAIGLASTDDAVRVIVLTGAGRGFCSGADISRLEKLSQGAVRHAPPERVDEAWLADAPPELRSRFSYFAGVPKPIIAAINGPCAGVGLVIACYCDIRIASTDALVLTAFARLGLIAEHGIAWILPRLIGQGAAMDLLLSSRKVSAAEAFALGLFNRLVAPEQLMAEVRSYAKSLSEAVSPRSVRIIKRQLWEAQFQSLGEALALANVELPKSFEIGDFREGVSHFVQKRKASFAGN